MSWVRGTYSRLLVIPFRRSTVASKLALGVLSPCREVSTINQDAEIHPHVTNAAVQRSPCNSVPLCHHAYPRPTVPTHPITNRNTDHSIDNTERYCTD